MNQVDLSNVTSSSFTYTAVSGNVTATLVDTGDKGLTIDAQSGTVALANVDTTSGNIDIDATGAITITSDGGVTTTGGSVDINSSGGGIVTTGASNDVADIVTATGTITLESAGGIRDSGAGSLDIDSGGGAVTLTGDGDGAIGVDYASTDADAVSLTVSHGNAGNVTYDSLSTGVLTVEASSLTNGGFEIHNDAGITVNGVLNTSAGSGALLLEAASGNIGLNDFDNTLSAGGGAVTVTASAGNITVANATANDEIVTTGTVNLTGGAIGAVNPLDINGATALTITDLAGAGDISIREQTASTIASTDITVPTATSGNIDIDYFGTDLVDINNGHVINDVVLSDGGTFTYTASADNIAIGSIDGGTGDVSLTATLGTIDESVDADTVNVTTGGMLTLGSGGAIGADTVTGALDLDVSTLEVTTSSGGIYIREADTTTLDGLTVGAGGVATTGGNAPIDLTVSSGNLVLDGPITANGSGDVDILLGGAGAAVVTDTAGEDISSTTGAITITADTLTLANGTIGSGGGLVLQPNAAGRTIGLGAGATGAFNLDATELGLLQDGFSGITIGKTDSGAVDINAYSFKDPVTMQGGAMTVDGLATGGTDNIVLTSSSSIDESVDADTVNVTTGGMLTLGSGGAIGADTVTGALDLDVSTLEVTTSSGGIYIREADTTTLDGLTVGVGGVTTTGGNVPIDLTVSNGNLVLDGSITADGSGAISITAVNGNIGFANLDNIVSSVSGAITVKATAGNITIADTTTSNEIVTTGAVNLTGGGIGTSTTNPLDIDGATALTITDLDGAADHIFIREQTASTIASTDITVPTATSGNIDIDYFGTDLVGIKNGHVINDVVLSDGGTFTYTADAGNIAIGSIDGGAGDVTLIATGGTIDESADDILVKITTQGVLALNAAGAIGDNANLDAPLDIDVSTLEASTSSGGIFIREADSTTVDGLTIGSNGVVTTGGNAPIELTVSSGNLTLNGPITANGSGNIDILLSGAGAAVITDTAGEDISSTMGDITISSDTLTLAGGTISSGGALILQPNAAGITIGLGDSATGEFNLNVSQLDLIPDGFSEIIIGRADSGAVDINAYSFKDPVSVLGGAMTVDGLATGGTDNIALTSSSTIDESVDDNTVNVTTGGTLTLSATGTVGDSGTVNGALDLDVSTLVASTSSGGIYIREADTATGDGLTAGAGGVTTTGGNAPIDLIVSSGDLTLDGPISADGSGAVDILLSSAGAALVTNVPGEDISSNSGAITISADVLTLAGGTISSTGALVLQPNSAGRTIGVGDVAAGLFDLDVVELDLLQDGFSGITIGKADSGSVDVNAYSFKDPVTIQGGSMDVNGLATAAADNISLISSGSIIAAAIQTGGIGAKVTLNADAAGTITDNGGAGIATGTLDITRALSIGALGAPLDVDIDTLSIANVSGDTYIRESSGVDLNTVTVGGVLDVAATAGDITATQVNAAGGATTLTAEAGAIAAGDINAGVQTVTLDANGAITNIAGDIDAGTLNITDAASVGTALANLDTNVATLQMSNVDGASYITNEVGVILNPVSVDGALNVRTEAGDITATDVDTSNDNVTLTAAGSIVTEDIDTNGTGATVTLNAGAGSTITDNGGAGIATGTLDITRALSIGALGAPLDVDIDTLSIANVSGDTYIRESSGVDLNTVTVGGVLDVTALAGDITATGVTAIGDDTTLTALAGGIGIGVIDGTGQTVTLDAGGPISTFGAGVVADRLIADAAGAIGLSTTVGSADISSNTAGAITINETDGIILDDIDTVDGVINITSGGAMTATDVTSGNNGNIKLVVTNGPMTLGAVNAGAGIVELDASRNIDGGSFTGSKADIRASTIGLNAPPSPNVDEIYLVLSSEIAGFSAKLQRGSLATRPPNENVNGPGAKQIGPWDYLPTEVNLEGILAEASAFSAQLEKLEELLEMASDTEFFMAPPLWIDIEMEEEEDLVNLIPSRSAQTERLSIYPEAFSRIPSLLYQSEKEKTLLEVSFLRY